MNHLAWHGGVKQSARSAHWNAPVHPATVDYGFPGMGRIDPIEETFDGAPEQSDEVKHLAPFEGELSKLNITIIP